jgi:hypothetical protein
VLEALMDIDRPIQRAADATYSSTPGEDRGPGRSHVCQCALRLASAISSTQAHQRGARRRSRHSRARSHRTHTCSPMRPQP